MILGVSGSPRDEKVSSTYKLVKTVLEASGCEYELISLRGKNIAGCVACLGCKSDNTCVVHDDIDSMREKIIHADAYVIGAPNYFSGMNAATHAFFERWYQFRHQECNTVWGKLGVSVGVGGAMGKPPVDDISKFFLYNSIETVAEVYGQGAASCFSCGYGETCKMGVPYMMYGEGVKITEEITPDVTKQCEVMENARKAGKTLGKRLRLGYDKTETTKRIQGILAAKFKEVLYS